jgi:hypothetical protein
MKGCDNMRIYANLLGNRTDITDTGTVERGKDPVTYFKENLDYDEGSYVAEAFKFGYILVEYQDKQFRLDPAHIQIET